MQLSSLLLFVYWWYCHSLPPGYAIGVLAVLAAAMSIHLEAKMQWWEKSIWMLLMGAFLILELRAISAQEEVHKKELADQLAANQATIQTIIVNAENQMSAIARTVAALRELEVDADFDIDCRSQAYIKFCNGGGWSSFPNYDTLGDVALQFSINFFASENEYQLFLNGLRNRPDLSLRIDGRRAQHTLEVFGNSPPIELKVLEFKPNPYDNVVNPQGKFKDIEAIQGIPVLITDDYMDLSGLRPRYITLGIPTGQRLEFEGHFQKVHYRNKTAFRFEFPPQQPPKSSTSGIR